MEITEQYLESIIVKEEYNLTSNVVTKCTLTLKNGSTVDGDSYYSEPDTYDREIGRKVAYRQAYKQIWPLEKYLMAEKQYNENKKGGKIENN